MSTAKYEQYLARFLETFGPIEEGAFVKHKGQLIQKLGPDAFREQLRSYDELLATYSSAIERGDTINDMVVRLLREHAAKLIQADPVEF